MISVFEFLKPNFFKYTWSLQDQDCWNWRKVTLSEFRTRWITVENSDGWNVRFCTKVQPSQISKFLGNFQGQKMDIISCHDCQFVKCKSQITILASFYFKYKKVHIHRLWDNENKCSKQCYQIRANIFYKTLNVARELLNCVLLSLFEQVALIKIRFYVVPSVDIIPNFKPIFFRH